MTFSRILALDYGRKRIGLAISDPLGLTAQPLGAVSTEKIFEELPQVVQKYEIVKIVIGLPKSLNGTLGPAAEKVKIFAQKISELLKLECLLVDERLSTKEVEKAMIAADLSRKKRREVIDQSAAALILQTYLDSQRWQL